MLCGRNYMVTWAWAGISHPLTKSKTVSLATVMLSHRWCYFGCEMGNWTGVSSQQYVHPAAVRWLNTKWGKSCVYGLKVACDAPALCPTFKKGRHSAMCIFHLRMFGQLLWCEGCMKMPSMHFAYTNDFWFKSSYNCFCHLITGFVSFVTQPVRLKLYDSCIEELLFGPSEY